MLKNIEELVSEYASQNGKKDYWFFKGEECKRGLSE